MVHLAVEGEHTTLPSEQVALALKGEQAGAKVGGIMMGKNLVGRT